MIDDPLG